MPLAIATRTANRKLARPDQVAYATHAGQQSCPASCPFLGNGCYAESGPQGIHTARLNRSRGSAARIAAAEARAIDALPTDPRASLLRLHTVGDCKTNETARTVAKAAERWSARCDAPAYGYTHAWRTVARRAWRTVAILASVETLEDAARAMKRGYAAALVVAKHMRARAELVDGFRLIPCPSQTRGVTCADCRLCFDDTKLRARQAVIVFEAHGSGARKVKEAVKW